LSLSTSDPDEISFVELCPRLAIRMFYRHRASRGDASYYIAILTATHYYLDLQSLSSICASRSKECVRRLGSRANLESYFDHPSFDLSTVTMYARCHQRAQRSSLGLRSNTKLDKQSSIVLSGSGWKPLSGNNQLARAPSHVESVMIVIMVNPFDPPGALGQECRRS
jgi:hypothetical protein